MPTKKKSTPVPLNPDGTLKHPFTTFLRLMFSDDNYYPSSARVLGTLIFCFIGLSVGALTLTLSIKLWHSQDPAVIQTLVSGYRTLMWMYTTLVGCGLSFYGINAWKYIAQIQSGFFMPQFPQMGGYQYGAYPGGCGSYGYSYQQPVIQSSPLAPKAGSTDHIPAPVPPKVKTPEAGVGSDD
jgi:hypothetical protein